MNGYLSRLNPSERRFVVVVGLLFFVVLNLFWVWPHFSDWGILQRRLRNARNELKKYREVIQQSDRLKPELARMEGEGMFVPAEDQATKFTQTIQSEAIRTGVGINAYGHQTTRTNQFFSEQSRTISVISDEKQLVQFLYSLGTGDSLVRVRSLSVHPADVHRQRLSATITLVASYQKSMPHATAPARPKATVSPSRTAPHSIQTKPAKPATPNKK